MKEKRFTRFSPSHPMYTKSECINLMLDFVICCRSEEEKHKMGMGIGMCIYCHWHIAGWINFSFDTLCSSQTVACVCVTTHDNTRTHTHVCTLHNLLLVFFSLIYFGSQIWFRLEFTTAFYSMAKRIADISSASKHFSRCFLHRALRQKSIVIVALDKPLQLHAVYSCCFRVFRTHVSMLDLHFMSFV